MLIASPLETDQSLPILVVCDFHLGLVGGGMVSAEALSSGINLIYRIALCGQHWPKFLEALKAACVVDPFFMRIDPKSPWGRPSNECPEPQGTVAVLAGCPPDVPLEGSPGRVWRAENRTGAGQSVISEEIRKLLMCDKLAQPGDTACQCDASFPRVGNGVYGDVPVPHSAEYGEFVAFIKDAMPVLAPHIQRAMFLRDTVSGLYREKNDLLFSLETFGVAIVGVDKTGCVVWLTEAAETLFALRDGIMILNNQLFVSVPAEQARLEELIQGASGASLVGGANQAIRRTGIVAPREIRSHARTAAFGGAMLVGRRAPKRALQIFVSPFHSSETLRCGHSAALVFMSDPDARLHSRQKLLQALYALGPVECRVCDLLVSGCEVLCIAEMLDISIDTVRFHLKSIFRKTGTNRQSELVRFILGLPAKAEFRCSSVTKKVASKYEVLQSPQKPLVAAGDRFVRHGSL
ncbi:MAG: helix-turn-helix transcriptional regulator [Acidobacteriaceae bacterium]